MTTTTPPAAVPHTNEPPAQSMPEKSRNLTIAFFVVGCVLLISCALAITHLSEWAEDYGQILVFVAFFLVMSLAGRWFWTGADAALTWAKNRIGR